MAVPFVASGSEIVEWSRIRFLPERFRAHRSHAAPRHNGWYTTWWPTGKRMGNAWGTHGNSKSNPLT